MTQSMSVSWTFFSPSRFFNRFTWWTIQKSSQTFISFVKRCLKMYHLNIKYYLSKRLPIYISFHFICVTRAHVCVLVWHKNKIPKDFYKSQPQQQKSSFVGNILYWLWNWVEWSPSNKSVYCIVRIVCSLG